MARGWESKSVEDQVEQRTEEQRSSPNAASDGQDASARAGLIRQRQALELQRERILDERTSNPIRRAALEAALSAVEAKLARLP